MAITGNSSYIPTIDGFLAPPPEFVVGFGSVAVGGSLALKVYVINETDNEAGSTTLVVTRPEA